MRHAAPRRTGPPVVLLVAILLAAVVTGVAAVVAGVVTEAEEPVERYAEPPSAETTPADPLAEDASPRSLRLLRSWDGARARAWAEGDPEALAALYTDGSSAGRRDVAMLRSYADRGLQVDGLRTQVLAAELRRSRPGLRVMAVTDRLVGGSVTDEDGQASLPYDAATRHVLTWRRVDGEWLMARVVRA